jgi:hypothetical protein
VAKENHVVRPAAVIASTGVGFEDDFRLSVTIEILAGFFFVADDTEPCSAKYYTPAWL